MARVLNLLKIALGCSFSSIPRELCRLIEHSHILGPSSLCERSALGYTGEKMAQPLAAPNTFADVSMHDRVLQIVDESGIRLHLAVLKREIKVLFGEKININA